MLIKIPFKTPSINHLYYHKGNMKFLTKEARELRAKIEDVIKGMCIITKFSMESRLKVTIEIHENWICKNGSVKKVDVANREKFMIDSIFKYLGLDDKFIFEQIMIKVQDTEEFSIIKLEEIK